jgi:phosphoadenosine phosphosulfate reductase
MTALHPFSAASMPEDQVKANQALLEAKTAEQRIRWALAEHGDRLILTTSFGIQSAVLLHTATQIKPDIPVVFIDTGHLFDKTYVFAAELSQRLNLNMRTYGPARSAQFQHALFGNRWETDLDAYQRENKIEPMDRAVRELGATAWLSGLRRDQSERRGMLPPFEVQGNLSKIYPLIDWSKRDIHQYLKAHDLPYHPMHEEGYSSVGDWHEVDTRGEATRQECGLHTKFVPDYQI